MNEYQKNIDSLNKMFDKLNIKYFGGTLERSTITIQQDIKAFGYFTNERVWTDSQNKKSHEINISPNFRRSKYEIVGTLLHEMVHAFAIANNIQDCSRQGRYHNKDFKKLASERGLIVDYAHLVGWGVTRPTENLCAFIDESNIKFFDCFRSGDYKERKEQKPRQKKYKYKCSCCDLEVEACVDSAQILCIACNKVMYLK